jgi:hypothetical protein
MGAGGGFDATIIQLGVFLSSRQIGYLGGAGLRCSVAGGITRGVWKDRLPSGRFRESSRAHR